MNRPPAEGEDLVPQDPGAGAERHLPGVLPSSSGGLSAEPVCGEGEGEEAGSGDAGEPAAQTSPSPALSSVSLFLFTARTGILVYWAIFVGELFAAGAITAMALWGLSDLVWDLSPETHRLIRSAYVVAALLAAGGLLAVVLRHALTRGTLASWMEAREPAFDGNLLAAVEALEAPGQVPPAVASLAAERSLEVLKVTGARPVHPRLPWNHSHLWLLGSMSLTLGAALYFGPAFFQAFVRGLFPSGAAEAVLAIRFDEVRPGPAEGVEGDALPVAARLSGAKAGSVYVQVRETDPGAGPAPVEHALAPNLEARAPGVWQGSLGVLRKSGAYRLVAYAAGSARGHPRAYASEWYSLGVRPRAGLRELSVWVEPPGYAGYRPYGFSRPTQVQALARSSLTVLLSASPAADLGVGHAELPEGLHPVLERLYEKDQLTFYRLRFVAERSGLVSLNVAPADETRAGVRTSFALSVVQDLAPEADAVIATGAPAAGPDLSVDLRLSDDLGLTSARLVLRPLPPEDGRESPLLARELGYEIPLPPGCRELSERWVLPSKGLEDWLAAGFLYQVEALDGAAPRAQIGRSVLRRWEPKHPGSIQAEQAGMLDAPTRRPMRSLTRPNALGKVPNPTPDELAQMGGLGAGVRPKQLERPHAERLESPPKPGEGSAGRAGTRAAGASRHAGAGRGEPRDDYAPTQGLKAPKPEPAAPDSGAGGKGEEPDEAQKKEAKGSAGGEAQPAPKTEQAGSGPAPTPRGAGGRGGSSGAEGKDGSGAGGSNRPGDGQDGGQAGAGGPEGSADAGGSGGTSSGAGSGGRPGTAGPGGQKPRDGGPKTGREAGPGGGRMAPPDLETLARIKGITTEDARAYLKTKGLGTPRTDYGKEGAAAERPADVQRSNDSSPVFSYQTVPGARKDAKAALFPPPGTLWQARLMNIDPLYRPVVEGYFKRLGQSGYNQGAENK